MKYKPKNKNIKSLVAYLNKQDGRQKDKCANVKK